MLVIDRKDQEKVKVFHMGEEFTMIVAYGKGKVKLIYDAPKSFDIFRTELLVDGQKPTRKSA
jgi:sRNA-binding carbon storage regulator CsrA